MSASIVEDVAKEFAARYVAPAAAQVDRSGTLPSDLFARLGEAGLLGTLIPEAYEGSGQNLAAVAAATRILAGACASTAWAYLAHCCAAAAITAHGTESAKSRYLPELASGKRMGAALVGTEASGGTAPVGMRSTARKTAEGWVLSGTKSFISNSGAADLYIVMARTGEQPGPGALSLFIVPKEAPGLSFGKREELLGVRGVQVGEVILENCVVPEDHLLGKEGGGLMAMGVIGGCGVVGATAAAVGLSQAAADVTRSYLLERQIMGKALATNPAVQQSWAQVMLDLEGATALADRGLAQALAGGSPVVPWLAKVRVTEAALQIIDRCIQLLGANGYSTAYPLERMYRDARALLIHWGNNDLMRTNAALKSLGLM